MKSSVLRHDQRTLYAVSSIIFVTSWHAVTLHITRLFIRTGSELEKAHAGLLSTVGRFALPKAMPSLRSSPAMAVSRGTTINLPGAFAAADFQADLRSLAAVLSQPGAGLSAEVWHQERCGMNDSQALTMDCADLLRFIGHPGIGLKVLWTGHACFEASHDCMLGCGSSACDLRESPKAGFIRWLLCTEQT